MNGMNGGLLTLVGLIAGAASGLALSGGPPAAVEAATAICRPLGRIWLASLQMTVLPLVVSTLITGVADVADVAQTGRLARRTLGWIVGLSAAAAIVAVTLARLAFRLLPRSTDLAGIFAGATDASPASAAAGDWLARLPDNVVAAAAGGAIAPVVVFTLAFALALARLDSPRRTVITDITRSVAAAMTILIGWILAAAPVGVFALALPLTAASGSRALGGLGSYVAVLVAVYLVITAAVYLVVAGPDRRLRRFAAAALPAQCVAAGTQSSLASLPAMLGSAAAFGCPAPIAGLTLPLAVSLFRITSPAQYLVVTEFIAWTQGVELGWHSFAVLVPLAVVISLGSVGLPGQASFMGTHLPIVQAAGLPLEPLGLLLAVDVIPDVAATVGNVTGDLAVTARLAAGEPQQAAAAEGTDVPRSG
jgi:proton glutamate symport protein